MTREEELDWLCRLRSEIYVYMPKEWLIPMNNALDMSIKALEQEPCEDAISRELLKSSIHNFFYGLCHVVTEEDIQAYIDAMPSVTPKEKAIEDIKAEIIEERKGYPPSADYYKAINKVLQIINNHIGDTT